MLERRKSFRGRTFLGASITVPERNASLDCLVRNLSPEGAKLAVDGPASVPDEFDLTISQKQRTVRARTIWRRLDAAVSFVDPVADGSADRDELARQLRRAQAERARLRDQLARMTSID